MKHTARHLLRNLLIALIAFGGLIPMTAQSYVSRYALGHEFHSTGIVNEQDPHERFNRAMFGFNDVIDCVVLTPVARFYNKVMPRPLNAGVHNFYLNIGLLPVIANDLLQLHLYQFTSDTWRLGVNTTLGIGGFFDVASRMNLSYYPNDFGLTLSRWGYKNSNYLVLPLFGPFTVRDSFGIPVDYYAFAIYPYLKRGWVSTGIYALGIVDKRAQLLKFQDFMEEASVDKYAFIRSAYMQHRAYQAQENAKLGVFTRYRDATE